MGNLGEEQEEVLLISFNYSHSENVEQYFRLQSRERGGRVDTDTSCFRHTRIIYAKSDVSLVALQSHDDDEGDDAWEDDDGTLLVLAFTCD